MNNKNLIVDKNSKVKQNDINLTNVDHVWEHSQNCHRDYQKLKTVDMGAIAAENKQNIIKKTLQKRYAWLFEKFPKVFEMVTDEKMVDLGQLKFMLDNIKEIQTGKQTQHDASVKIGRVVAETYAPHLLKKPDNS